MGFIYNGILILIFSTWLEAIFSASRNEILVILIKPKKRQLRTLQAIILLNDNLSYNIPNVFFYKIYQ